MWLARVGAAGPVGSRLGLGCLPFSGAYGRVDQARCATAVHSALDLGVALLDVTDFSADGAGQRAVAAAIGSHRDEVLLSVHVGWGGRGADPGALAAECEDSLRRIGTEHLDLCYLHGGGNGVPIEERIGELASFVTVGKIRHLGVYGVTAEELSRAHAVHPVTALAAEYALWLPTAHGECLRTARRLGIGIVACRPLGRGFLTGRIRSPDQFARGDLRRRDPRFSRQRLAALQAPLRRLERIAAEMDLSTGRLALAWLLAQGEDVVPVPGSTNPVHLEMNVSALGTRLPAETVERLVGVFAQPPGGAGPGRARDRPETDL